MKIRKPDYYDRFQCIAGACSDSCCVGWEIDVDEDKREAYRSVTGELGERLRTCVDWEEGHFILQGKEERCPFLNKDNLCDLIIGLGEEALCEICREHPRYYEWYGELTEVGVGLCCEAAARLVLESEHPATFVEEEVEEIWSADEDAFEVDLDEIETCDQEGETDDTLEVLFEARDTAFRILQNRDIPIWSRLRHFALYIDELQEALDFENLDEVEESAIYHKGTGFETAEVQTPSVKERIAGYRELLVFCRKLEPIDESWPKRLDNLEKLLDDPANFCHAETEMQREFADREYEYEHLAVYFVYRYFMKCRTDGDVYSRGCLAIFCVMLIRILDCAKFILSGTLTKEERIQNAKDSSKEIEYSEENLSILADLFWEHGFDKIIAGL